MKKTCTARELLKILRKHDRRFELNKERGKGSHALIYHPDINGKEVSYFIPCPRGDKSIIGKGYMSDIKKLFNLPPDLL